MELILKFKYFTYLIYLYESSASVLAEASAKVGYFIIVGNVTFLS